MVVSLVCRIAGTDRAASVMVGSIQMMSTINARDTATFRMSAPVSSGYRPVIGQTIGIEADNSASVFGGTIDEITETLFQNADNPYLVFTVRCVDWTQVFDRHLVAAAWENYSASQICASIVSGFLTDEGITSTSLITDTTPLERVVFNYCPASRALDDICELMGYSWYVDPGKNLHVFEREDNPAPFDVTEAADNFRNMRVQTTREKYRNRQYVKAAYDLATSKTEYFMGDGKTQSFPLSLPVGRAPSLIRVWDGGSTWAASTIGIRNVDTGYQWYWEKNSPIISQDPGETALQSTKALEVRYSGMYPILIKIDNAVEIQTRKTVEGGAGIYEGVSDDTNLLSEDVGMRKGQGLLDRYGHIPKIVTFETDTPGLRAGQLVNLDIPTHDVSGQYLIESVTGRDVNGAFLRWSVRALSGESLGGWVSFFKALIRGTDRLVLRENEVVLLSVMMTDTVICSESLTATEGTVSDFVGSAIVGVSIVY